MTSTLPSLPACWISIPRAHGIWRNPAIVDVLTWALEAHHLSWTPNVKQPLVCDASIVTLAALPRGSTSKARSRLGGEYEGMPLSTAAEAEAAMSTSSRERSGFTWYDRCDCDVIYCAVEHWGARESQVATHCVPRLRAQRSQSCNLLRVFRLWSGSRQSLSLSLTFSIPSSAGWRRALFQTADVARLRLGLVQTPCSRSSFFFLVCSAPSSWWVIFSVAG